MDGKNHVIRGNLAALVSERRALSEKELAQLGELAEMLCDEAGEDEIFFRDGSFIARYHEMTASEPLTGVAEYNRERVKTQEQTLSVVARAFLCRRLCENLGIVGSDAAGTFFDEVPDSENEMISYLKSSYADRAYDRFSEEMTAPKVLYGDDFTEVCENVYYGRCAYCILPIENTVDGRLAGFRGLIIKYGLKIASICRIKLGDEGETVFALLKRSLILSHRDGEFSFDLRVFGKLYPLLTAAEACGMSLLGVTSVSGGEEVYDLVLKISPEGFCGFLCFLHLEYPGFIPVGISCELTA